MMVQLERTLEVMDSLGGKGSRAAHQAETRTSVQPLREEPVMMTGDSWSQMHTKEGAATKKKGHSETRSPKEGAAREWQHKN
jgi:hypothetical protein